MKFSLKSVFNLYSLNILFIKTIDYFCFCFCFLFYINITLVLWQRGYCEVLLILFFIGSIPINALNSILFINL